MFTQELAAFLYLIASVCFIMALRGLSSSDDLARRQPLRHRRHGDRDRHDSGLAQRRFAYVADPRGRSLIGGAIGTVDRPAHPDDGPAAAGRGLPQLVGLAAVFVAGGGLLSRPSSFGTACPA
jgi:NAD(P) transhydrogenase subunit beta